MGRATRAKSTGWPSPLEIYLMLTDCAMLPTCYADSDIFPAAQAEFGSVRNIPQLRGQKVVYDALLHPVEARLQRDSFSYL